jgi:membrane protein
MPWTTSERVMAFRSRHPAIDVAIDALDGYRRHLSGRNAWLLAFFGFLSIFPLLLAATTILGFVLEGNEELQQRIIDGALADIPVLGQQLADDPASLDGNIWALVIGLGGALWSATKAFVAMQGAQDDVWEIDVDHRASMPAQRGKALLGLLFIGVAQLGTMIIAAIVNAVDLPLQGRILLVLATVAVNIWVLAAMYRFLTSAVPTWRDVWPGALFGGLAYTVLQHFGTDIVRRITENAGDTYGSFALVLGLITWLSLLAMSALMAAELNAAMMRHGNGSLAAAQPTSPPLRSSE